MIRKRFGVLLVVTVCGLMPMLSWADDAADAKDPTKERYCDPSQNADTMGKIRSYERQMDNLPSSDAKAIVLNQKIAQLGHKLQCIYRTKKDSQ